MTNDTENKIELRDIILGGQDGLVNVLGLSLGLFAAHAAVHIILVAGLAAGFSEAVSMGAVAYTSATTDKVRLATATKRQILFSSGIVGISALAGACIPIFPFLFLNTAAGIYLALFLSVIALLILGIARAKSTNTSVSKSAIEIVLIGIVSAFAGFVIGLALQAT